MRARSRLTSALVTALGVGTFLSTSAEATTVPSGGAFTWCSYTSRLCVWEHSNFGGKSSAWLESDSNWHNGDGLNVADKDSSFTNYSNYSVAVFKNSLHGGGCKWTGTHGGYNYGIGIFYKDDGSSHRRYTVDPC